MKPLQRVSLRALVFTAVAGVLVAAAGCGVPYTYTVYNPVYADMAVYRADGAITARQVVPEPDTDTFGKIALSADRNWLFVTERNRGVRVADISNPSTPRWIGFIEIPGTSDLLFLQLGGTTLLYVDSFIDLVVVELTLSSEPGAFNAQVRYREEAVFPQNGYQIEDPDQPWPVWPSPGVIPPSSGSGDQVVVGFTTETVTQWSGAQDILAATADSSSAVTTTAVATTSTTTAAAGGNAAGAVGSMARFGAYHSGADADPWYLYAVDNTTLRVFQIAATGTALGQPQHTSNVDVGWGIETIFPYKNLLFLGSASAMYIYNVAATTNSSPSSPYRLSSITHVTARDPVVVGEVGPAGARHDTAFVTLRSSSSGWGEDLLIAVDVSNPAAPRELTRRAMSNPHGLGLYDAQTLIVCEGSYGIKVIDVAAVHDTTATLDERLRVAQNLSTSFDTYDIIPGDAVQIVVGPEKVAFYDYQAAAATLTQRAQLTR